MTCHDSLSFVIYNNLWLDLYNITQKKLWNAMTIHLKYLKDYLLDFIVFKNQFSSCLLVIFARFCRSVFCPVW